jgi:hypothetical protein
MWMPPGKEKSIRERLEKTHWSPVPLYFGRQATWTDDFAGESWEGIVEEDAKKQGQADATGPANSTLEWQSACTLAETAGLPEKTVIYLDIEEAAPVSAKTVTYAQAWVAAIRADPRYQPGVYCPRSAVPAIFAALTPAPKLWAYDPPDPAIGCVVPTSMDPAADTSPGVPVQIRQYQQGCFAIDPGSPSCAGFALPPPGFDLNVATSANPAEDSAVDLHRITDVHSIYPDWLRRLRDAVRALLRIARKPSPPKPLGDSAFR